MKYGIPVVSISSLLLRLIGRTTSSQCITLRYSSARLANNRANQSKHPGLNWLDLHSNLAWLMRLIDQKRLDWSAWLIVLQLP